MDAIVRGHVKGWNKLSFDGEAPTPRSSHTMTVLNDQTVIVFGGYCLGSNEDDFYEFNPRYVTLIALSCIIVCTGVETMYSKPLGSMSQTDKTARVGHSGVVLRDNIYYFGGWDGKSYLNNGFIFNFESMDMTMENSKQRKLPDSSRDHVCVRVGDRVFLFGGWNCVSQYNDIWMLSSNWTWTKPDCTGTIPIARRGHSASVVGTKIYIFGGIYGYSKYLGDLVVFDTETFAWSHPQTKGKAPHRRAWHSACAVGKQIVVFGGTSGRLQFHNDVHVSDTETNRWFAVPTQGPAPSPRCSHTAAMIGSKLLVFGGLTPSDKENRIFPVNDVFVLETSLDANPTLVEIPDDEDDDDLGGVEPVASGAPFDSPVDSEAKRPIDGYGDGEFDGRVHAPSVYRDTIPAPMTTDMEDVDISIDAQLAGEDEKLDAAELPVSPTQEYDFDSEYDDQTDEEQEFDTEEEYDSEYDDTEDDR